MDAAKPAPDRPATPPPGWEAAAIIGGGILLLVAFLWGSYLLRPRIRVLDRVTGGRLPDGPYIGSRVCAECHPGEHAHFTRSGHALTFRNALESKVARRLIGRTVNDPEIPGVTWTYKADGDRFFADRAEQGTVERFPLEYGLGSGRHSLSFLTVIDPAKPTSLEHRLTYFAASDALDMTTRPAGVRQARRDHAPWQGAPRTDDAPLLRMPHHADRRWTSHAPRHRPGRRARAAHPVRLVRAPSRPGPRDTSRTPGGERMT